MNQVFFALRIATASAARTVVPCHGRCIVRAKFSRRKRHCTEGAAGILAGGRAAFLFGQAIFGSADKKLPMAHQTNHRKQPQGNDEAALGVSVTEGTIEAVGHDRRHVTAAAAATGVAGLNDACAKHDRLYDLYSCPLIGMCYAIIKSEKSRK